jgi:hypothetical protein
MGAEKRILKWYGTLSRDLLDVSPVGNISNFVEIRIYSTAFLVSYLNFKMIFS